MASTSKNLRDMGVSDCLFVTVNHTDGSVEIGTNFVSTKSWELTPDEVMDMVEFLLKNYQDHPKGREWVLPVSEKP